MDIPGSILKDHLIPKAKDRNPKLLFKGNDESYGIPQKEIPELKRFVTNAIPFFDMSYEVLNNLEKPRYGGYELHMLSDGSTFIERIEGVEEEATTTATKNDNDITAKKANTQRRHFKPIIYLKWTLGELLF